MKVEFEQLVEWASEEVEDTLSALPAELQAKARALPVTFEPNPNTGLQEDGIAPDTLGLFVGPEFSEEGMTLVPLPPQIILFLTNLWDFVEHDEEIFRDEVHTTFMHELGHYLGLDEDDRWDRGLD
jgi:predicted Zn-dependent protease with MMP-like domain